MILQQACKILDLRIELPSVLCLSARFSDANPNYPSPPISSPQGLSYALTLSSLVTWQMPHPGPDGREKENLIQEIVFGIKLRISLPSFRPFPEQKGKRENQSSEHLPTDNMHSRRTLEAKGRKASEGPGIAAGRPNSMLRRTHRRIA